MKKIIAKISLRIWIVLYFVTDSIFADPDNSDWNYPEPGDEFPKWGGLCEDGKMQSPRDLKMMDSQKFSFPNFVFGNYDNPLENPKIQNDGHTVKITAKSENVSVTGGPLEDEYVFHEINFHWASEHAIDGYRYPLEMHLVYVKKRFASISEAKNHSKGLAIFAVLYVPMHMKENKQIENILKNVEKVASSKTIGENVPMVGKLTLRNLLPIKPSEDYFFYRGSLTTPPCSEVVSWIVYLTALGINLEQVERFNIIETKSGKRLRSNFRNIQHSDSPTLYITSTGGFRDGSMSINKIIFLWKYLLLVPLNQLFQYA